KDKKDKKKQKQSKTDKKREKDKDQSKSEETARIHKPDQPDTARTEVKSQNKVKRINLDKCLKIQGLI
ncbi:hypothetical protein Tco_1471995, partial [Tanacetum coccineum]